MEEEKITKKDIQKLLSEQTNVILSAVDEKLESKADRESTNKILTSQNKIITKLSQKSTEIDNLRVF